MIMWSILVIVIIAAVGFGAWKLYDMKRYRAFMEFSRAQRNAEANIFFGSMPNKSAPQAAAASKSPAVSPQAAAPDAQFFNSLGSQPARQDDGGFLKTVGIRSNEQVEASYQSYKQTH